MSRIYQMRTTLIPFVLFLVNCTIYSKMATVLPFPNKEMSAAFSRANKGFLLSLLKQLPSESNIFFSPFSISTALAMVHMGARTETLKEMSQALHFEEMGQDIYSAFSSYLDFLSNETGDCTLKTANRIYQSMKCKPEESFLQDCNKHFKASVEAVDFSQSEAASKKINSWVSQQTENKIQDLIPATALNDLTFMVLVNAIYFKGNWNSKFESKHTQIMEFRNTKEKFMTDMMYQKASFRFCHVPDLMLNALELPYQGKTLSMLILLPTAVDGIENLEKNLTESVFKSVVSKLRGEKEVQVYLPKFKMESTFQLKSYLSALGMPTAFDENKADFTGMDKDKDVYISEVFHKAFVEVNEEGTEAAAATGVVMVTCSAKITPEFRANHPFLFFIRDSVNDVILFAGRFHTPTSASMRDEL